MKRKKKPNPFRHVKDEHEVDVTIERIITKRNISEKAVRTVLKGMEDVLHHLIQENRTITVSGYLTFERRKGKGMPSKMPSTDDEE
jgi:nucleoid DNA-binding protein